MGRDVVGNDYSCYFVPLASCLFEVMVDGRPVAVVVRNNTSQIFERVGVWEWDAVDREALCPCILICREP